MPSKDLTVRLLGDVSDLNRKLGQAGNDMQKVGAKLTRTVTPAAAAVGVALTKVGSDWNAAVDAVIVGTGATGDALEGLLGSTKKVAGQVPNDFGSVGEAIAEVNTRLGLTGPELEDTSKKFLDLSRITGTDVKTNIAEVSRVFGDWSVETEDQSAKLDMLFAASQNTGIGVDRLSQLVVQFGAPLRQMGFSLDESVALFGKFEKEGVNTEAIMSGLRMGLGRMAKAGEEPIETFQRLVDEIKNAGSTGEANAIALEGFGQRAGPDMAAAIREGRFELDDLVSTLAGSEGALDDAADRTLHLSDRLAILRNKLTGALGPFGELGGVAAGAVAAIGPLLFGLGAMAPALGKVTSAFRALKVMMLGHPIFLAAAAITGVAAAVSFLRDEAVNTAPSVDELVASMEAAETAADGWFQAIVNTVNGNDDLADAMDAAGLTHDDLAAAISGTKEEQREFGKQLEEGAKAAGLSDMAILGVGTTLESLANNLDEASGKQERNIRLSGDATEATALQQQAVENLIDDLDRQTHSTEDATEAVEGIDVAAQDAADSEQIMADKTRAANQDLRDQQQAAIDARNALRELAGGALSAREAELQLREKVRETNATLDEHSARSETGELALIDLAREADNAAQKQVELAGTTTDTAEGLGIWNANMLGVADGLNGPMRTAVLAHIARVNGIPPERITEIQADTDPNDIAQIEAELDHVARDRSLTVSAFVTTHGSVQVRGRGDHGGTVPGPRGSEQLILAHGGETVLPTHKSQIPHLPPLPGSANGVGGGGIDYDRLAGALAKELRRAPLQVQASEIVDTGLQSSRYRS